MAKFLDTPNIISAVNNIIKNAKNEVYLISPYIDLNKRFMELIEEKNEQNVHVIIIWGKKRKQPKFNGTIKSWINSMSFVDEVFHKDLHAKCYLNESEAIITSMNIYEASEKNVEMGILVNKKEDNDLYSEIVKEVNRLIRSSKKEKLSKSTSFLIREDAPKYVNKSEKKGYCVRCREPIKLNIKLPYCKGDWKVWNNLKNKDYTEKEGVCHICCKSNKSSMNKPVCKSCYNKNKHLFNGTK